MKNRGNKFLSFLIIALVWLFAVVLISVYLKAKALLH